MRGGHPSITTPTPPPCDSPKVVMRKSWPKLLPMTMNLAQAWHGSGRTLRRGTGDVTVFAPAVIPSQRRWRGTSHRVSGTRAMWRVMNSEDARSLAVCAARDDRLTSAAHRLPPAQLFHGCLV